MGYEIKYFFGYKSIYAYPLYSSKERFEKYMKLLLIGSEDKWQGDKSNYVYIKDFNRFMYNKTKHKDKKYFCVNCLQYFSSKGILKDNWDLCSEVNGKKVVNMSEKDSEVQFINHHKQLRAYFCNLYRLWT